MTVSTTARLPGNGVLQTCASRHKGRASLWVWTTVLSAMLLASGCGGADEEPSEPSPGPEAAVTSAKEEPEKPPPEKKKPSETAKAAKKSPPALPEEPPEETEPRPEQVVDWAAVDYFSAKRDRDPRLVDALAFLGVERTGDETAVDFLMDLLATPEAPPPDPGTQPKPKPRKPKSPARAARAGGGDPGMDEAMEDDDGGVEDEGVEDEGVEDEPIDDPAMEEDMDDAAGMEEEPDEGAGRPRLPEPARRTAPGTRPAAKQDGRVLKPAYVSLLGAAIRALGTNGTDASREVLQGFLAGTVETDNDRVAVSAALKALVDDRCPENEAILLRALTQSEQLRPEGRGSVTAEQLRETTFKLVTEMASPEMRMDLAKYLFSPNPSVHLRGRLVDFIMNSHPYNVTPQTAIYPRPQTSSKIKQQFEVYFTTYSSLALGRLLGVSAPERPEAISGVLADTGAGATRGDQPWVAFGGGKSKPLSATAKPDSAGAPAEEPAMDEPEPVGIPLEAPEMEDDVVDDGGIEPEDGDHRGRPRGGVVQRDLSKWASGSDRPQDSASITAYRRVARRDRDLAQRVAGELWSPRFGDVIAGGLETIRSLEAEGQLLNLASTVPTDTVRRALYQALQAHWEEGPGGLFAAAALPQDGAIDPGFMAIVKTIPREVQPTGPTAPKTVSDRNQTRYDWMDASRSLLRYLCDRFQKAAESRAGRSDSAQLLEGLPLEIHDAAGVVAAYRFDWQDEAASKLDGLPADRLVVHYVHIRGTTRYSRMLGYYRRAIASTDVHELDDRHTWIDSYRPGSEPDRRRSVDILITRAEAEGETDERSAADEPLDVEILSIEINDPSQS